MIDLRPVFYILGVLLCILAATMTIPVFVDLYADHEDWKVFAVSAALTGFCGMLLLQANSGQNYVLNLRQAFILTPISWLVIAIFSSLPLYFSALDLSYAQAFFETTSGVTTTGATVIIGLDEAPPGILMWRSIMHFLGGIGFIAAATAILPLLGIGGMQIFKTEGDSSQKFMPRTSQIAKYILGIYVSMNIICATVYYWLGMGWFDAVNHAFSTIATAGFSTHDDSIGFYKNPSIEVAAMFFMLISALPVVIYYRMLKGNAKSILQDTQIQTFLFLTMVLSLSIAVYIYYFEFFNHPWIENEAGKDFINALRYSFFSVIAIITTTGFTTIDYGTWGVFPIMIFFLLMSIGGCTGSTAGGMKIFRIQILYKTAKTQVSRLINPHGVFRPVYNGKPLPEELISSVLTFFILFAISFTFTAILLALTGLDFLTSISTSVAMLGNIGPALGEISGPAGTYNSFPPAALWVCSFAMFLGRLEILVVIVLFSKTFWRD